MSYQLQQVESVCKLVTSGGTPLSSNPSFYEPKEIPWLKTAEVNYCHIYDTENYISEEGLRRSSAKLIPVNSVIVAMYGQGDTAGRVAINKIPLSTNQACCNLVIDDKKADYRYVYYALTTLYEKMVSLKNGGAQPNLNAGIIKAIEIPMPTLHIQKRIADILSTYDDLIENNQKQIKLLEEAAQRLYKEWFVDLHFPGHEKASIIDGVPGGWHMGTLIEIAEFHRGKTITKAQVKEGNVPVVAGGLEPAYYHNVANTKSPVITVSGSGANAGFSRMYHEDVFASDCSYVDIQGTKFLSYVYCFLRWNKYQLDALQKGSAQPHVYAKDINAMEILIPSSELVADYCKRTDMLFIKIGVLQRQMTSASEARNRLIPKLMSGEIEV